MSSTSFFLLSSICLIVLRQLWLFVYMFLGEIYLITYREDFIFHSATFAHTSYGLLSGSVHCYVRFVFHLDNRITSLDMLVSDKTSVDIRKLIRQGQMTPHQACIGSNQ